MQFVYVGCRHSQNPADIAALCIQWLHIVRSLRPSHFSSGQKVDDKFDSANFGMDMGRRVGVRVAGEPHAVIGL